ncbi:MAG TPA: molecular chaperone HtpG [Candidatus Onthenecus intestinigallinarum]|uniref:Molecular chaperone HtpG n=1 Tax=Candidatus Onthenecus intestinigallinarum TaxID=2840875 RepID=A0A9D0ZAP9_9FIRM|nr:molecular chaperone HtpG [Candidatus Onthenecus intestinigallinarum]
MEKKTGNVSIHAQNIMPVIKKWLYSDKDIFVREMVSNACDAVTKMRIAGGEDDYQVHVEVDAAAKQLRFIDNGIGMTADEVERYIGQVAFSGAEEFLKQYDDKEKDGGIIGHFGLGFYSAFMVASKVTIDTLSYQPGAQAVRWESEDGMTYTLSDSDWDRRGTRITLDIAPEEEEFLRPFRVREVLERYCAFMQTPIFLDEIKPEGAKDDGPKADEAKETAAPVPVNDTHPLWLKNPSDCTEEEYKAFYRKVFREFEEPLFWVHLNVDYPFNLKGILYFPKLRQDFGGMEGQIKLFSGQVFVADNIKEVIPEFLMLLKGVIDCPDLPLNVSRSFLQNDGYVRKISAHITRKVADRLTGMFNTDRPSFEKYWPDIHPFIKYGCMRDEKFYERMKDVLLYKTVDGRFLTLAEYTAQNGEKAPDKVLYTSDESRQDAMIRLYRDQGIDVVVLDTPIDVNFASFMEYSGQKDGKLRFCRVDADTDALKAQDAETPALDAEALTKLFREATGMESLKVELQALRDEQLPAMLVEDEQTRRFKDMSRLYGEKGFSLPDDFTLVLNSRSALVSALAGAKDPQRAQLIAAELYDLAELSRAPLSPQQMTAFLSRSMRLCELAVGND